MASFSGVARLNWRCTYVLRLSLRSERVHSALERSRSFRSKVLVVCVLDMPSCHGASTCRCWSLQHSQVLEPAAPAGAGAFSTCKCCSRQHLLVPETAAPASAGDSSACRYWETPAPAGVGASSTCRCWSRCWSLQHLHVLEPPALQVLEPPEPAGTGASNTYG